MSNYYKTKDSSKRRILELFLDERISATHIAARTKVSLGTVYRILKNISFKDVEYTSKASRKEISEIYSDMCDRKLFGTVMDMKKVREMRVLYKGGSSYKELAEKFGVTTASVGQIVNNHAWKEEQ